MSSSRCATSCCESPCISSSYPCSSRSSVTKAVLGSTGTRSSFRSCVAFARSPPRPARSQCSRSGDHSTASRGCVLEVATDSPLPTVTTSVPWSGPRRAASFPAGPGCPYIPAHHHGARCRIVGSRCGRLAARLEGVVCYHHWPAHSHHGARSHYGGWRWSCPVLRRPHRRLHSLQRGPPPRLPRRRRRGSQVLPLPLLLLLKLQLPLYTTVANGGWG
jgi:hypothetical protein